MMANCPLHGAQVCTCRFAQDARETARLIREAKEGVLVVRWSPREVHVLVLALRAVKGGDDEQG